MKRIIINDLAALDAFARETVARLEGGHVIGLVGDLGAGKTAFVQRLAKALGIRQAVKSPTFILMQVFATGAAASKRGIKLLCHVDAYRLKNHAELAAIGFSDFAGAADTLAVVEWADRVPELHAIKGYQEITFKVRKDGSREVIVAT